MVLKGWTCMGLVIRWWVRASWLCGTENLPSVALVQNQGHSVSIRWCRPSCSDVGVFAHVILWMRSICEWLTITSTHCALCVGFKSRGNCVAEHVNGRALVISKIRLKISNILLSLASSPIWKPLPAIGYPTPVLIRGAKCKLLAYGNNCPTPFATLWAMPLPPSQADAWAATTTHGWVTTPFQRWRACWKQLTPA